MRTGDIALMLVRLLGAYLLIMGAVIGALSLALLVVAGANAFDYLIQLATQSLLNSVGLLAGAATLLAGSRGIAGFAARYASDRE